MGMNPLISVGAPIAGNLVSALVSNQARRRAQERLNSLQTPQLPAFRRNPLLGQRIAQQQQLADQPMMGYQRAADEQAGRQFERGRRIAANLGGGAGLAYMQGVSSNIASQQRKGLLSDMIMQQRNRADLDQLINMQNQEMAQERAQEQLGYQMAMRDFMDQRSRLQSDIGQQQSNIAASIGGIVGDIPNYATAFRNYNIMRDMTPRGENAITPAPMLGGAVSNTYAQEMPIMRGMTLPQAKQVAPNVIPAPVAPAIAPAISAQAPIRMTEMSPVAIPPVGTQTLPERLPGVIPATSLMARQIPNEASLSPMARRAALNSNMFIPNAVIEARRNPAIPTMGPVPSRFGLDPSGRKATASNLNAVVSPFFDLLDIQYPVTFDELLAQDRVSNTGNTPNLRLDAINYGLTGPDSRYVYDPCDFGFCPAPGKGGTFGRSTKRTPVTNNPLRQRMFNEINRAYFLGNETPLIRK